MKLSIIIPVYNEKDTLLNLIKNVEKVDLGNIKKEIILVDDYSNDGTRELLKSLKKNNKYKIILKPKNVGKGDTVKIGLENAIGDINIIQDADEEYDPNDYTKILKPILNKETEVVYGSRFLKKGNSFVIKRHYYANQLLSLFTSILYLRKITDMETCYKCFTKKVKEHLLKEMKLKPKRFDLEPEITAKIIKSGFKITEVPISYKARDFVHGKKIRWKDGIGALISLVKYRFVN